jgi:prevent-host-death family protein
MAAAGVGNCGYTYGYAIQEGLMQVSVRQARDNLSQLIKDAQAGEDVVIANHGQPVARLVPVSRQRARLGEWLQMNPPATGRSAEEIDGYLSAERDSWE